MADRQRIVAHLGRPETPEETATRKAESSRAYRGSQTMRNLIVALLVSIATVVVIVWIVPRGELPERPSYNVAAVADQIETTTGHVVVRPEVPEGWRANIAELDGLNPQVWTVALARSAEDQPGYAHVMQAFDADATWAAQTLDGAAPTGTVDIDGRAWDEFALGTADDSEYALSTQAGADRIVITGTLEPALTQQIADQLGGQLDEIEAAQS